MPITAAICQLLTALFSQTPSLPCQQAPGIDFDCGKAAALAQAARDRGMLAGIALTPDTQPEAVFPLCEAGQVDTVLLLAVRAGFGGQVRGAVPWLDGGTAVGGGVVTGRLAWPWDSEPT